jgi:hypothetical protein
VTAFFARFSYTRQLSSSYSRRQPSPNIVLSISSLSASSSIPTGPSQGAPGYLPVRLDITNSGEAREIVLTASQQHWFDPSRGRMRGMIMLGSFDMGSIDTQQTIRLKRGDHVKITVPIPVFADNESIQIRLRERGRAIEGFSFPGIDAKCALP